MRSAMIPWAVLLSQQRHSRAILHSIYIRHEPSVRALALARSAAAAIAVAVAVAVVPIMLLLLLVSIIIFCIMLTPAEQIAKAAVMCRSMAAMCCTSCVWVLVLIAAVVTALRG